jgi:hypothetical protein
MLMERPAYCGTTRDSFGETFRPACDLPANPWAVRENKGLPDQGTARNLSGVDKFRTDHHWAVRGAKNRHFRVGSARNIEVRKLADRSRPGSNLLWGLSH